jgi:hypothetical protein
MPVPSVTLPAWVLASAGMMDTPGRLRYTSQQQLREDIGWRTGCGIG